jgi:hypothetical protein
VIKAQRSMVMYVVRSSPLFESIPRSATRNDKNGDNRAAACDVQNSRLRLRAFFDLSKSSLQAEWESRSDNYRQDTKDTAFVGFSLPAASQYR